MKLKFPVLIELLSALIFLLSDCFGDINQEIEGGILFLNDVIIFALAKNGLY